MRKKFPGRMTYTQWLRTPFRRKHRLLGLTLNTRVFRYWRDCGDARCRRARACQDHECYWRRLEKLRSNPDDVLRPEMYVDAEIETGTPGPVLAVPESAVLDNGTRRIVLVDKGE